jgi:hypothetical protein
VSRRGRKMALEAAMGAEDGSGRARIRAADVDRDRVAGLLGTAYTEGRLSKDEYDDRLAAAFSARTYGDLDRLLADLPGPANTVPANTMLANTGLAYPGPAAGMDFAARPGAVAPVDKTNGFALASLFCGLSQFLIGPLGTIPAIVFGHMARNQIKRTGEQGAGLALVGLVLGYGAVVLGMILVAVALVVASRTGMPAPAPGP